MAPVRHPSPDLALAAPSRLRRAAATDRRLLSRSSLTFAARVLAKGSQFIFLIAIARLFSVDEFASYSYLVGLALTFSLLGDTGVALAASRDVAAARMSPGAAFAASIPVVAVGAAITSAVTFAFGILGSGPGSTAGLLLLVVGVVFANTCLNFVDTMLRGVGRFTAEAALQIVSAFAFLALAVGAAAAGLGLWAVLTVLVVKEASTAVVAFALLRPSLGERIRAVAGAWKPMFVTGIRLGLASTALAVATRSELIVLGNSAPDTQVAWFSGPLRLADTSLLFALAAGYALLPGVTYLAATDPARARQLVWRVAASLTAVATVIGVVLALGSDELVRLLFGERYAPAAPAARVLLAGMPAYAMLGIVWYALISLDAERLLLPMAVVAALCSLVAGLLLIPPHEAIGAAWVYTGTVGAMAVAGAVLLGYRLRNLPEPTGEADVAVREHDSQIAAVGT